MIYSDVEYFVKSIEYSMHSIMNAKVFDIENLNESYISILLETIDLFGEGYLDIFREQPMVAL